MHIAYNKIHHPKQDFRALEKCCRAMEKKYGLKVDLGKEDKPQEQALSPKARDYEAMTWEQSFEGYVKEHKEALLNIRNTAKNWQDLHIGFADYNLEISKRGNGLVIKEIDSDRAMKASNLERSFSKAGLEKEFGAYKGPEQSKQSAPKQRYKRQPITKYPKQSTTWTKYLAHTKRKESLAVKIYRSWREFLAADSLSDPLAIAIITHHKKMLLGIENRLVANQSKNRTATKQKFYQQY